MARRKFFLAWSAAWLTVALMAGVVGCGGDGGSGGENKTTEQPKGPAPLPAQGPNGGRLLVLGAREYVVEIVPAGETVSFYLLDANAKKPAPLPVYEIVVNTKAGGKTAEHKVNSQPLREEFGGKSSRFIATEKKAVDAIIAPATEIEVVLAIGDKKLSGSIKDEAAGAAGTATGTATGTKPAGTAATPSAPATGTKPTGTATATATGSATATGTAEKK
jgi:hypothetical protein